MTTEKGYAYNKALAKYGADGKQSAANLYQSSAMGLDR
jgi:hypothetical protein